MISGVVESFDERRGDGIVLDDSGRRFYFHCVEIVGGSRSIAVGVRAQALRSVGRQGRDEAVRVTPLV